MSTNDKVISAKDIVAQEHQHNLDNITKEKAIAILQDIMSEFEKQGGKPVVWKKPHYLLVPPTLFLLAILIFIAKFNPSWQYIITLTIGCLIYFYIRYEDWITQKIEIYPYGISYTFKYNLIKAKTIHLMFGTSDFARMQRQPYGNFITQLFKIRTYMKSSDIIIYNTEGQGIRIPSVYQCEHFTMYIEKKVNDYLCIFDPNYQTKTEVLINGNVYEKINGKMTRKEINE